MLRHFAKLPKRVRSDDEADGKGLNVSAIRDYTAQVDQTKKQKRADCEAEQKAKEAKQTRTKQNKKRSLKWHDSWFRKFSWLEKVSCVHAVLFLFFFC